MAPALRPERQAVPWRARPAAVAAGAATAGQPAGRVLRKRPARPAARCQARPGGHRLARGEARLATLFVAALGVLAVVYSGRFLARILSTGVVRGRWGDVHVAPEPKYWLGVLAGVAGVALGATCVRMAWRWWRDGEG